MTFANALYTLILSPLELFLDVIYSFALQLIGSPGLSLIFLSLALNLLVLPLYNKADAMQQEERDQTLRLQPGVDHINRVFKGDERFMILQTYYRQNHYKPYYVLKGSLSLLLQIPFFIAAYNYLSNLTVLHGVPFGPIQDLSAPDGLIKLAGLSINLLPILMTAINILSGVLYTRGMPLKSKIQLYGMALIFLVLLYPSPSGLVFYWALNNLFSLVKNIVSKLSNPRAFVHRLCSFAGFGFLLLCFLWKQPEGKVAWCMALCFTALLELPLFLEYSSKKHPRTSKQWINNTRQDTVLFLLSCILLALLTGFVIPSDVIRSSPGEFITTQQFSEPIKYVISALLYASGTFLLWMGIFYSLASKLRKTLFSLILTALTFVAIIDYMFFGRMYGPMSSTFVYEYHVVHSIEEELLWNLLTVAVTTLIILLIWSKKPELLKILCLAGCIALAGLGGLNAFSIQQETKTLKTIAERANEDSPTLTLDKEGKNVIVIMLDRALSGLVPYMMNEKPELKAKFAGFTYYPNTISYGSHTNLGAPGLFGGYEYIPEEMNKRENELLKDKHNEALKVMPVLFMNNGYEVTVCDPVYANYQEIPDLSIYDDYPAIHAYTLSANWQENWEGYQIYAERLDQTRSRNLFCYSIFRASPVLLHVTLYDDGLYHEVNAEYGESDQTEFILNTVGADYYALNRLPSLSEITDTGTNTFTMMENDLPHNPGDVYQEPEYILSSSPDNTAYEAEHSVRFTADGNSLNMAELGEFVIHYRANMATLIQLGNWFDYLREMGVYDNTRIILASDHGFGLGGTLGFTLNDRYAYTFPSPKENYIDMYTSSYVALLMVKDFDSQEYTTNYTFMTNADTPLLAFKGLIENPVNPFTQKTITDEIKQASEHHIIQSYYSVQENNGTTFRDSVIIPLRGNDVFKKEYWPIDWFPED